MSVNIFVDTKDLVEIDAYAYEGEGGLSVVLDASEVPADTEAETLKFSFRKPNHKDSVLLTSSTISLGEAGVTGLDVIKLQDECFRVLLIKWNIKSADGKTVPITRKAVDELHPNVVRTVAGELLGKIQF